MNVNWKVLPFWLTLSTNFGDAATAIPLWIALTLARWKPSKKFTYGYSCVEDLAGVAIVLTILFSAIIAGNESIIRLFHPRKVEYLWAVIVASVIGFLGNEAVAQFRIKVTSPSSLRSWNHRHSALNGE